MTSVTILLAVVVVIAAVALVLRRTAGRARTTEAIFTPAELRAIGAAPDTARFVLFTAPGCAPCAPARRVLDEVAVHHTVDVLTVDVTQHEQLARSKQVWRAPTVFVVDASGQSVARISGVPRAEALHDALTAQSVLA